MIQDGGAPRKVTIWAPVFMVASTVVWWTSAARDGSWFGYTAAAAGTAATVACHSKWAQAAQAYQAWEFLNRGREPGLGELQ